MVAVMCLVLAGEWDRAAACVERADREATDEARKAKFRALWEELTTDTDRVCAKAHAWEAETVKALKLERIWEPAPFPVELPASERGSSAEPLFPTTPWIPSPPGLWQEVPTAPGEVRFAKHYLYTGADLFAAPLSPEEAEERHRALENYAMVARLPDGLLLVISFCGWDRNDPEILEHGATSSPFVSLYIGLHGMSHFAVARTWSDRDRTGVVDLWTIETYERFPARLIWSWKVSLERNEKTIDDKRGGKRIVTRSVPTPEERDLVTLPIPPFGEYATVAARLRALLHLGGYGDFV